MKRSRLALVLWLLTCYAAALVGGLATSSSVRSWYPEIVKPSWTPPSWLFGPVWTVLYAAMAVSAWLVWKNVGLKNTAMALFLFQLSLNALWSILFSG